MIKTWRLKENDEDKIASIKQTKEYLRIKDTYGEEFADALYFGIIE